MVIRMTNLPSYIQFLWHKVLFLLFSITQMMLNIVSIFGNLYEKVILHSFTRDADRASFEISASFSCKFVQELQRNSHKPTWNNYSAIFIYCTCPPCQF